MRATVMTLTAVCSNSHGGDEDECLGYFLDMLEVCLGEILKI